jgi:hypothetical protein
MTPDAAATILAATVGGVFGLLGVAIGFFLGRIAAESDRHKEALFAIYVNIETLKNLLIAFQKRMIDKVVLHPRWAAATEKVLGALLGSGLNRKEKKQILHAINGKWEEPKSVTVLSALGEELLKQIDPEYAEAAKELLQELGVKPEDIDPTIVFTPK